MGSHVADPEVVSDKTSASSKTKSSGKDKAIVGLKLLSILALLYFFICSLDLLASAFQLLAGTVLGELIGIGQRKK
jgi:hypothetical protein